MDYRYVLVNDRDTHHLLAYVNGRAFPRTPCGREVRTTHSRFDEPPADTSRCGTCERLVERL